MLTTVELVKKYRHIYTTDYTADANCVAAYLFTEGTGTTVEDSSSNSNTGTFSSSGHPAWDTTDVPFAVSGSAPNSVDFATNDYIEIATDASLNITGNLSIVAWVNPDGIGGADTIFEHQSASSPYQGYSWRIDFAERLSFWDSANWIYSGWFPGGNAAGSFHHYAVALSSTTVYFYKDGIEISHTTSQAPSSFSGASRIGTDPTTGDEMEGKVTDLGVFNDYLTSTEINEIMDYGLAGSQATGYMTCMKMW